MLIKLSKNESVTVKKLDSDTHNHTILDCLDDKLPTIELYNVDLEAKNIELESEIRKQKITILDQKRKIAIIERENISLQKDIKIQKQLNSELCRKIKYVTDKKQRLSDKMQKILSVID